MNYDGVLAQARSEGAPVFLLFTGSMWCPHCKEMERNVFSQQAWKDRIKDSYLVQLDFPYRDEGINTLLRDQGYLNTVGLTAAQGRAVTERNWRLHALYTVPGGDRVGFPTVVVLNSTGTVLGRFSDHDDPTPAYNALNIVLGKVNELLMLETGGENDSFAAGALTLIPPEAGMTATTNNALGTADTKDWYVFKPNETNGAAWIFTAATNAVTNAADATVTLEIYKNPADPPVGSVTRLLSTQPTVACFPASFGSLYYVCVSSTNAVNYRLDYQTLPTNAWAAVAETIPETAAVPRTASQAAVSVRIRRFSATDAAAVRVAAVQFSESEARAGVHFTPVTAVFTLAPEETEKTFTLNVPLLNPQPESWRGDKTFKVAVDPLSNCVAAAAQTLVTITETVVRQAGSLAFSGYGIPQQRFDVSRAFAFTSREEAIEYVWVERTGGTDGAVTGRVTYVRDDYTVNKIVVWKSGAGGAQQVRLYMPAQISPPQSRTLEITLTGDPAAPLTTARAGKIMISLEPAGLPDFVGDLSDLTMTVGVNQKLEIPFECKVDGTVLARVTNGRLPFGVGLSVEGQAVRLDGIPRREGVYAFQVELKLKNGSQTFIGGQRAFTLRVAPLRETVEYDPMGWYDGVLKEGDMVCGSFSMAVRNPDRISFKVKTLKGIRLLNARGWTSADEATGLHLRDTVKNGLSVDVRLTSAGLVYGQVVLNDGTVTEATGVLRVPVTAEKKKAFEGYYTAALPVSALVPGSQELANAHAGSGYLTVRIDGRLNARYSGQLADGTGFSGSARCLPAVNFLFEPDALCVPVVVPLYRKRGSVVALIGFRPGEATAAPEGNLLTFSSSRWFYPGKRGAAAADRFEATLQAGYGAYYGTVPALSEYYGGKKLDLSQPPEGLEPAAVPVVAKGMGLTVEKNNAAGATLSAAAKTGLFKGFFSVQRTDGTEDRIGYKGILVPAFGRGEGYYLLKDPEWWTVYRLKRSYLVEIE